MKYLINSYDAEKDIANVTINFKFKTVNQPPETVRAHFVPVEDKVAMDAWVFGFVAAKKDVLRKQLNAKVIDPKILTEQTVADPVETD